MLFHRSENYKHYAIDSSNGSPEKDAKVIPINAKTKKILATQSVKKKTWHSKLAGLFFKGRKKGKSEEANKESRVGKNDQAEADQGFDILEEASPIPHRPSPVIKNETVDEELRKVEGSVYSFLIIHSQLNLRKSSLRSNNLRFHLPYIVEEEGIAKVINVYCDPEPLFMPAQEEVERKKRDIFSESERINIVADDLSQAKRELAVKMGRKREKAFTNLMTSGVVEELDRIDRSFGEKEAVVKKEETINDHLRIRKDFSWDIKVIDASSSLKEDVEIYQLYLPKESSINKLLSSFIQIIDDDNYKSLVMLFYKAGLIYEKVYNLRNSLKWNLKNLSYDYSRISKEVTLEDFKQFLLKLIESLDALLSVLHKYCLIRESAYREVPTGFVEVMAGPGLYKDPFTLYCCKNGDPSQIYGKCCLNFPSFDDDLSCFQHFINIFNNFDPSK